MNEKGFPWCNIMCNKHLTHCENRIPKHKTHFHGRFKDKNLCLIKQEKQILITKRKKFVF